MITRSMKISNSNRLGKNEMSPGQAWPFLKFVNNTVNEKKGSVQQGIKYHVEITLPDGVLPFDLKNRNKAYHACKDTDLIRSLVDGLGAWTGDGNGLKSNQMVNKVITSDIPNDGGFALEYTGNGDTPFTLTGEDGSAEEIPTVDAGVLLVTACMEGAVAFGDVSRFASVEVEKKTGDLTFTAQEFTAATLQVVRNEWQNVLNFHKDKCGIA